MKGKRSAPERSTDERRRKTPPKGRATARRQSEAPGRRRRSAPEQRPQRSAPQTSPVRRPVDAPARPKNASQAKARAKARKAKAPKVVRPPLRERLITRLATIDLNPRTLAARVPFVVLVIAALGIGHLFAAMKPGIDAGETDWAAVMWIGLAMAGLIGSIWIGLGFIIGSTLLFSLTARAFGRRALPTDLVIGLVLATLVYLLFNKLLKLALPSGPLERLF